MIDIDGTYIPDEEVDKWEYEQDKAKHDEMFEMRKNMIKD